MKPRPRDILVLLLAGCASPAPDRHFDEQVADLQEWQRRNECGFNGAMGFGAPLDGRKRAESGDAVRACDLPTVAEVESTCEAKEAVPIPGTSDPDSPDDPQYDFPEYSVSELSCIFTDASETRARCSFKLAAGTASPQHGQAEFTYRFSTFNTPLVFGYDVGWRTATSCLPDAETDPAA